MKFLRILVLFAITIAFASCGSTKKTATKVEPMKEVTENVNSVADVKFTARKREMTKDEVNKWPHMDIYTDSVPGISLAKAYKFIANKDGKTVIVGVIDSGIDIEHEDLKNLAWTNKGEIPNNNIDDDKNGYIDDIHGWNFLGGEKGSTAPEQLEVTRLVTKLSPKYAGKTIDQIAEADKAEFEYFTKLNEEVTTELKKAAGQKAFYQGMINTVNEADKKIKELLGKDDYTVDDLTNLKTDDKIVEAGKGMLLRIKASGKTIKESLSRIQGGVDYFGSQVETMYNVDFNGRVTGDNPDDFSDNKYGNNYIIGSKDGEMHGTHVSGIICAERNNEVGMNGVAHNVALMCVRAVPDGDEYDKDVALAIRYVVDNGAKVVNMSFGKAYSPHSEWVYDAIKYAEKHDVLLVKAAGNNGENIDMQEHMHYPTDSPVNGATEIADNVLTVGAMTRHFDKKLCATFSNYGKTRVDIFAPGLEIYSTVPKDEYKSIQGTSMASPEVAGVAALVRSYYPSLTASQVKHIIMDSGIEYHGNVIVPGTESEEKSFDELSVNGRIVNAYNALVMAHNMVNAKK
jgi:subtilisin family serine protease